MRSHLGNRVGLATAGLGLAAAGGVVLWLRVSHPAAPIVDPRVPAFLNAHPWLVPVAAVLCFVLALVATRWLVLAAGWGRRGARSGSGTAMLGVGLRGIAGVTSLRARLVGERRLRVRITCDPRADLGALLTRLDGHTASRMRAATGVPDAEVLVRLHVRRRPASPSPK
jgi:hypothetical protein